MTETIEGLESLRKRFRAISDTQTLMGTLGLLAVQYAKEEVPRKTGDLFNTIRLGAITADSAQVLAGGQNGVGYAQVVEFGSRPHVIRPRRKKALFFAVSGKTGPGGNVRLTGSVRSKYRGSASKRAAGGAVFAMVVHHPGTKPHPYLVPAAHRAIRDSGAESIIRSWNNAA